MLTFLTKYSILNIEKIPSGAVIRYVSILVTQTDSQLNDG
jgi:hypothetical protein